MTDIVERLRDFARDYTTTTYHDELVCEAADRIEELEIELGKARLCLTCGKTRDAVVDRHEPGCESDSEYGHLCLFDATPNEAWQHWRQIAHDQRSRIEELEAELAQRGEPVATLHDDGCFTWKRDEFRHKYDRQRAGWRMDVYAAPPQRHPLSESEIIDATVHIDATRNGYFIHIARAVERAHGITEQVGDAR